MFALKRQLRGGALQKVVSSPSSLLWVNQGRYLPSIRYQSNITENKVEPKDANGSISDAEVDSWLEAIESLRSEFTDQQFLPETSLAGPGQSKINIMEEALNAKKTATVTEEQQAEWDALKAVPLPARKDEILQHVTNMIMRHGKKQRAEDVYKRQGYHFSITCWQYCRFSRQHRCFDNHSYTMLISYKRMLKSVNYDRYSSPCTSQSHSRISSRLYKMISIPIFSKPDAPAKLSKSFLGLAPISHSA